MSSFWNWVKNEDTGQRELFLEGVIAQESWFGDEVTPAIFKDELNAGDGPITIHINSVGGDCIAASMIYTMLMDYKGDVTVQIDGVAASAASVIAMAGTRVCMSPTSLLMLHNPWTSACGDTGDMQKAIALLTEVKESIINAYELKTGLDRQTLAELMDQETWLSAYRAKELGFCDDVLFDGDEPEEKVSFSYSDKLAAMQVMNLAKAMLPEETKPDEEPDEAQPVKKNAVELQKSSLADALSAEAEAQPDAETAPDPVPVEPAPPRLSVRDTDNKLENLRY